jgi:hypothetical protein
MERARRGGFQNSLVSKKKKKIDGGASKRLQFL